MKPPKFIFIQLKLDRRLAAPLNRLCCRTERTTSKEIETMVIAHLLSIGEIKADFLKR